MFDRLRFAQVDDGQRTTSETIDLDKDNNGNEPCDVDRHKYLRMLREASPDPDSLSIISDYSVMGQEIQQSIRFSDMIMSTYSDLRNPNKSMTVVPINNKKDQDMIYRKHNMLSLAMEFSRWKQSRVDLSLGEYQSDSEARWIKDDCGCDTTMASCSASLTSEFSSVDLLSDPRDDLIHGQSYDRSPLQVHIDQKFEETFSGNKSSSDSEVEEDKRESYLMMPRASWAPTNLRCEALIKLPETVRLITDSIRNFDLSKEKYLQMLNVSLLQLVLNELMTQIEDLNDCLVATLISRDELRSEQTSMVIQVEERTIKARNAAQRMRIRESDAQNSLSTTQNYGIVHRFLSNLKCSPKVASNRVISFFSPNNPTDVSPSENI